MPFLRFIETAEQERERLAQAPEGSINHHLSTLPVNIPEWPQDLLVQLPWEPPRTDQKHTVVVVPFQFRGDLRPKDIEEEPLPRKLHSGSWDCIVVSSDHPSCPVGGYRIVVCAAEIARGTKVDLTAVLDQP
ncbi:hypothetical protein [Streptomyces sp. NBC_01768]|uniref:hypothetical protein n=1 Tax=Streptomyces sp. NBC_01768 TaxID=2975938 RepID=UPI002DD81804|nr:hypothetical protein [Streptomyces sp. NBC_01768]WSC32246.1 hypothetical protein OG902_39305 [Streptomyces sp. NBC_01768]